MARNKTGKYYGKDSGELMAKMSKMGKEFNGGARSVVKRANAMVGKEDAFGLFEDYDEYDDYDNYDDYEDFE